MVIEAEAVAGDRRAVMKRLWAYVGLPYVKAAFEWDAAEVPKGWEHVRGWHNDAVSSSGIRRDDKDPDEVFEAVAAKADHLREYLAHHWEFYDKLKAAAGGSVCGGIPELRCNCEKANRISTKRTLETAFRKKECSTASSPLQTFRRDLRSP